MIEHAMDEPEATRNIELTPGLKTRFDILSDKLGEIVEPTDTDEYHGLVFLVFNQAEHFRRLYVELYKSGEHKEFRDKIYDTRLDAQSELKVLEIDSPIERPALETIWDLSELERYHYQDRPTPWARYVESLGHYLAIYPRIRK